MAAFSGHASVLFLLRRNQISVSPFGWRPFAEQLVRHGVRDGGTARGDAAAAAAASRVFLIK
ncbi:hypothetical protein EYF80_056027 [Liparis tanakae]|uniref:Uncharacterized protein n=1 Tax=Liparis tanakae TaxID=230148 RepID=A0A4Z2EYH6_9TELE|nr:hypothetical protein EYF80_056027 [Liparis tanakae]